MAKSGGTTRSGSSSNPRGTGAIRSTSDQERLMNTRDRITSLEYERDNLSMAGGDQDEINQLTAQIADLREVVRRLERNEQSGGQEQAREAQRASNTPATFTEQISAIARRTVVSRELNEMTIRDLNSKLRVTQRAIGQVDTLPASNETSRHRNLGGQGQ